MPKTEVLFYCEADGSAPVKEWLDQLHDHDRRAYNKCRQVIARLATFDFELRRPIADLLQDGIYELRARSGHVNYRLLYFFHGRDVSILAHALTKGRVIPRTDLDRAIKRKRRFEADPEKHTLQLPEG